MWDLHVLANLCLLGWGTATAADHLAWQGTRREQPFSGIYWTHGRYIKELKEALVACLWWSCFSVLHDPWCFQSAQMMLFFSTPRGSFARALFSLSNSPSFFPWIYPIIVKYSRLCCMLLEHIVVYMVLLSINSWPVKTLQDDLVSMITGHLSSWAPEET